MVKKTSSSQGQRQKRVAQQVYQAVVSGLTKGVVRDLDPFVTPVTITHVEMSGDLSVARLYFTPLGGGESQNLLDALNRGIPSLRFHVGKQLRLRQVPQLRFIKDPSFDHYDRISKLLEKSDDDHKSIDQDCKT